MQVQPKIVFRVEMNTGELKLIRRALTLHGGNALKLCDKITEQINRGRQELVIALEASLKIDETIEAEKIISPKSKE